MTVIKRRSNGTIEVIEDAFIEVSEGDSVFSEATQAAAVDVIPAWQASASYSVDDVVSYDGKLWRVLQAHTSQLDWLPGVAFSLFTETWASGVIPNWKQPLGAHDAYPIGFEVWHDERIWVSNIPANVWQPNSVANTWTLRDDQEPIVPETDEWQAGVAYSINDIATYGGTEYICIQAHTAQVGWQPPNVPALWGVV
jgi:hypothetical protein